VSERLNSQTNLAAHGRPLSAAATPCVLYNDDAYLAAAAAAAAAGYAIDVGFTNRLFYCSFERNC